MIPRLWVGPDNELVECGCDSHSAMVAADPSRYGLAFSSADFQPRHDDPNLGLDYDFIICLAQEAGWVRVSHDSTTGIAISAVSESRVRAALRAMRRVWDLPDVLDIEIERLAPPVIKRRFHHIDNRERILFLAGRPLGVPRYDGEGIIEPHSLDLLLQDA